MSIYAIALFFHIAGALGFFIVQGVEWIGLSQIRSATRPEEAHAILGVIQKTNQLAFVSILTIIITGLYMMLTVWRGVPWILVVLGALVLEFVLFVALSRPRVATVERALDTEESPLSKTFHTVANHPILWVSIQTRTAILLGIVFLKIAKPDLSGSLLTIGVAIALGLASALPELRHERVQVGLAARMIIAFAATVFVAALVLLAAKSISARAIPPKPQSEVQNVQVKPSAVPTGLGSSNRSTQVSTPSPEAALQRSTQLPTPSPETALQEGPSLLQTRCTQCHSLQKVQQAKKTRAEWERTLAEMKIFGAKISDTEEKALLDYLSNVNDP